MVGVEVNCGIGVGLGVLARQIAKIAEIQVLEYATKPVVGLMYVIGIGLGVIARQIAEFQVLGYAQNV